MLHQLMKEEGMVRRDIGEGEGEERTGGQIVSDSRLKFSGSGRPLILQSMGRGGPPLPPAPLVSTSLDWVRGREGGVGWAAPSSPPPSSSPPCDCETSPGCTWRCGGGGKGSKEVSGLAAIIASLTLR